MRIMMALGSLAIVVIYGCARVTAETTATLYEPKTDLKFDPRLLGVWLPDTRCVKLQWGEGNSYLVGHGGMSWLVVFGDAWNKQPDPDAVHLVHIGKREMRS